MNTNWKVIVGTLAIFLAGLVTGIITQKVAHHHQDHFGVMHEFRGPGGPNGPGGPGDRCEGHGWFHHGPSAGGEQGRPEFGGGPGGPGGPGYGHPGFVPSPEFEQQLRDYDAKLSAVLEPFKAKEKAVFTADQQKKLEELKSHHFDGPVPPGAPGNPSEQPGVPVAPAPSAGPGPGLSEHHGEWHPPGLMRFVGIIIYKPVLAHLTEKLSLTAKQQAQLEAIFKDRREAVLKFVDDNPPPTIKQALATPPPVPATPAPTPSSK